MIASASAATATASLFMRKGVPDEKIVVTGIPNFDDCKRFLDNDFPASRLRAGVQLRHPRDSALGGPPALHPPGHRRSPAGRPIIWKLHPNENAVRARAELARHAPDALVLESGNTEEMIANCAVLVTQFSSTAYVGLALGKEVHSYFDVEELARLCPIQNGSTSARRIADGLPRIAGLDRARQRLRPASNVDHVDNASRAIDTNDTTTPRNFHTSSR